MDKETRERVNAHPAAYLEIYQDSKRSNAYFGKLYIGNFGGYSNKRIFWTKASYEIVLNGPGHAKALVKAKKTLGSKISQRLIEDLIRYDRHINSPHGVDVGLLNERFKSEFLEGMEILPEPPVRDLEAAVAHYFDDSWWALNSD